MDCPFCDEDVDSEECGCCEKCKRTPDFQYSTCHCHQDEIENWIKSNGLNLEFWKDKVTDICEIRTRYLFGKYLYAPSEKEVNFIHWMKLTEDFLK